MAVVAENPVFPGDDIKRANHQGPMELEMLHYIQNWGELDEGIAGKDGGPVGKDALQSCHRSQVQEAYRSLAAH